MFTVQIPSDSLSPFFTVAVKMNGRERCSRGNVIVSALTRFLKIGTQANVKRKVSDLVVFYSSAHEGSENRNYPLLDGPLGMDGDSRTFEYFTCHGN